MRLVLVWQLLGLRYIGVKQLFVRFCGCNLNCKYCDTDFGAEKSLKYSVEELLNKVNEHKDCHSISLTGGEPLLQINFLKEFLPKCDLPIYLETNGTLANELEEIIDYIDYISADIKLPSATYIEPLWDKHYEFFSVASKKILFAKIVFDEKIMEDEINKAVELVSKYNIELILQPKSDKDFVVKNVTFAEDIFDKFLKRYKRVRLIPQVHKYMNVR